MTGSICDSYWGCFLLDSHDPNFADARKEPDAGVVPDAVLEAYPLDVCRVEPLETHSYNIHFRVDAEQGVFDLRRSNRPTAPPNLLYEASLLSHLKAAYFGLSHVIIHSRDGISNVWHDGVGWTLFPWMGDGPKIRTQTVNEPRRADAAIVLARLHEVTRDFRPSGRRGDWPIFAEAENWKIDWLERAEALSDRLGLQARPLRKYMRQAADEMDEMDHAVLPSFVCHGDYRPANVRFQGDSVDAVFDFDTAFVSSRLLDLGGVVTRFSPEAGHPLVDVEAGSHFLRVYNAESPFTAEEWEALPAFIRWRLIRDMVIYFDNWWFLVEDTCHRLFDGAAEAIVNAARSVSLD